MSLKQDKVISFLQELASNYLNRESNRESLITVTRVDVSPDLKRSTVYVTILPEEKEEKAIVFLSRKGGNFRDFVKKHSKMRILPYFEFKLDKGERARQRMDELSKDT